MGGCSSKGNAVIKMLLLLATTQVATGQRRERERGREENKTQKTNALSLLASKPFSAAPPPSAGPNAIRGVGVSAEPRTPSVPRVKLVLLGDSVSGGRTKKKKTRSDAIEAGQGNFSLDLFFDLLLSKRRGKNSLRKKKKKGVGKSCLVLHYVRGCFDPESKVTVGAAYLGHRATLEDGRACKLEVWDTAGQERYSSLAPLYYRGAAAAAVVFDVCDRESFAKARHWVGELQRNAGPGIGKR